MAKLLTGYTGENIYANDDQDLYKGIVGKDNFVFDVNNSLALTVLSADNTVTATIAPGVFSFNGRIVRVSTTESYNLQPVENERYKKCIIVARYSVNPVDLKEFVEITPLYSSESKTSYPDAKDLVVETNESRIIDGSTSADFPLYEFVYSNTGIVVESKKTLFTISKNLQARSVDQAINDIQSDVGELQSDLGDLQNSVGTQISNLRSYVDNVEEQLQEVEDDVEERLQEVEGRIGQQERVLLSRALSFKNESRYADIVNNYYQFSVSGRVIIATLTIRYSYSYYNRFVPLTLVEGSYSDLRITLYDPTNGANATAFTVYIEYSSSTNKTTFKIRCSDNPGGYDIHLQEIDYVSF